MAIRHFKDIIDNKAYRISNKDREIFERGNLQSFFGLSDADVLEFILYDMNDNQLPQGDDGKLVRYIPMTTENIRDYFMIADSTRFQQFQFPSEYFIDAEALIRDAGYRLGRFKVQITLLNKRVGYENQYEKLWITDISASRTEVKVYPLKNQVTEKSDIFERYAAMLEGKPFKSDLLYQIPNFLETINPFEVHSFIREEYGQSYLEEVQNKYQIDLEEISTKIYNKFIEVMGYAFTDRYYQIDDIRYGKPKEEKEAQHLSVDDIYKISENILKDCINHYIPLTERYIEEKPESQLELQYEERKIESMERQIALQSIYELQEIKRVDVTPVFKRYNGTRSKRKGIDGR